MISRILTAITIIFLTSCNEKMEFNRVESESSNKAPDYQDVFLVANSPKDEALRDSLLVAFAKKQCPTFVGWMPMLIRMQFSF